MTNLYENTPLYSWEFNEFTFKKKKNDWFWILGLIAIALIVLAIFLKNYLFIFLIVIGSILMGILGSQKPEDTKIIIGDKGITIHHDFFKYEDLVGFWMMRNEKEEVKLLIQTKSRIAPVHSLLVPEDIDPLELHEFLSLHIEEKELFEPLTNRIINKIGF